MKQIKLTKGLYALVDDDKFDLLNQYSWSANYSKKDNCYRATAWIQGRNQWMHRIVLNLDSKDLKVVHLNGNRLDNRIENLKVVTLIQVNGTRITKKISKSGYRGVYKVKNGYSARIMKDSKHIGLGTYPTKEEAAREYNKAAREYFGELAYQN